MIRILWKYRYLACRMPGDVSKWAVSVSAQGLAFCGVMGIFWAGVCWGRAQGSAWRYKMRDLRRPRLNICFTWLYRIIRAAGNADLEWFKLGVSRDLHKKSRLWHDHQVHNLGWAWALWGWWEFGLVWGALRACPLPSCLKRHISRCMLAFSDIF